jgi:hypothetical protein
LGVWNFGFTVFWLAGYLGVLIPGFTVPLDLRILHHTWIPGLSVWIFAAGRMVLRFFHGSHGTLVAASAPFMMPPRDSDIPMNVPSTIRNKQPLTRRGREGGRTRKAPSASGGTGRFTTG